MKEKIVEIYTDASGSGKNGIGVLFINPDETERQFSYKINNSIFYSHIHKKTKNKELTSVQLEIFAIYVAIKELENYSRTHTKIYLYSDSLNVIESLNDIKNKYNFRKNIQTYSKLIKKLIEKYNLNIEFRWIKSHCGVYGNEIADRLARVGAREEKKYITKTFYLKIKELCGKC